MQCDFAVCVCSDYQAAISYASYIIRMWIVSTFQQAKKEWRPDIRKSWQSGHGSRMYSQQTFWSTQGGSQMVSGTMNFCWRGCQEALRPLRDKGKSLFVPYMAYSFMAGTGHADVQTVWLLTCLSNKECCRKSTCMSISRAGPCGKQGWYHHHPE